MPSPVENQTSKAAFIRGSIDTEGPESEMQTLVRDGMIALETDGKSLGIAQLARDYWNQCQIGRSS